MAQLNVRGQALLGVGDGIVSVDKRVLLRRAGHTCWLDDQTVIANARNPVTGLWRVVRCDLNGIVAPMEDPPDGANAIAAGGGRWLAWRPRRGVYGSLKDMPRAGVLGAGPDGTLGYCRDYLVGTGLVLNAPDGSAIEIPGVIVYHLQIVGPTAALWYTGSEIGAVGIEPPRPALRAGRLRRVVVGEEVWLVYWHNVADAESRGLIAQRDGDDEGYVLEPRPIAFNHDAVAVGTALVVAWSAAPGERPEDLVWRMVDRTKPRIRLGPAPTPPPGIPVIGRPVWLGFFEFGATLPLPANCHLPVTPDMRVRTAQGTVLAQYVAGSPEGDIDAVDRAIADAKRRSPDVPVLAYWTRGPQGGRLPVGADVIGIDAYRGVDEPLAQFERRIRIAVSRCPRAWLIAQAYTSNASLTTELGALVPIYARIARDCPNVDGILVFSAGARDTGWTAHAEIHDAWRTLAAGIPSAPPTPTAHRPPPPPPPAPTPVPTPTPVPSEESQSMIAYAPPIAGFKPGDLVDNSDGTVSVKLPSGKFLCITPEGKVEDRDTPGGPWESFRVGKAALLAERDGDRIYVLPLVE